MDVKDAGDLIIYTGTLSGALFAIGLLIHWVAVRPLKAWIEETQIRPLSKRVDKLDRDLVEHMHQGHGRPRPPAQRDRRSK